MQQANERERDSTLSEKQEGGAITSFKSCIARNCYKQEYELN